HCLQQPGGFFDQAYFLVAVCYRMRIELLKQHAAKMKLVGKNIDQQRAEAGREMEPEKSHLCEHPAVLWHVAIKLLMMLDNQVLIIRMAAHKLHQPGMFVAL